MINRRPRPQRDDDLDTLPHLRVIAPLTLRKYPRRLWIDRVGSIAVFALLSGFILWILLVVLGVL